MKREHRLPETKVCEQCGDDYPRPPKYSQRQWDEKMYCSRRCFAAVRASVPRSDEVKAKMSEANKGTRKTWAGFYERTEAYREAARIRIAKMPPEKKAAAARKISLANTGKKRGEDSRKKMRDGWKKSPRYKGGATTRKERKAFSERQREARKRSCGAHSLGQWEALKHIYRHTCPSCLLPEPLISLTEDHIIPISRGGSNNIENIQPLCRRCNSSKMTTPISYLPPNRFGAKEYLWRPIQKAMIGKESTADAETPDYSEIHKVLSRHLGGKFGVEVPEWPSLR